jgi:hypothetical protein
LNVERQLDSCTLRTTREPPERYERTNEGKGRG